MLNNISVARINFTQKYIENLKLRLTLLKILDFWEYVLKLLFGDVSQTAFLKVILQNSIRLNTPSINYL